VHALAVYRRDRFFEKQVGCGLYNKDDLTVIKIPANIPGLPEQSRYENVFGEVQFKNIAYNYVKIKITRKAIYLWCVPNYGTTRLSGQNIIDAKTIPNIPVSKKDNLPFHKAFNLSIYREPIVNFNFVTPERPVSHLLNKGNNEIIESFITSPSEPPERA
jgi:hypothetical protein